jgi:CheY-like chemotaxis protein
VARRQHRLVVALPPEPLTVDGDPVRLAQVVTNLLQNAAKYTPDGGEIRIAVQAVDECVEIRIRDNGAGITPESMPHIFELFVQDERPLSRSQGGLGIGLTMVRRLVELHGGTVEARSAGAGQGSEFTVGLPIARKPLSVPRRPQTAAIALAPSPARVLLVEDNIDAADLLAHLLGSSGHDVHVARDGWTGIRRLQELRPHVVLCDIGLPGMDGFEVADRMRALDVEPRPLLVALTGYGGKANAERSRAAGFDHHIVKPADLAAILRLIDEAVRAEHWGSVDSGPLTDHGSLRDDDPPERRV